MPEYIELEAAVKAFNNFDAGRADSPPFTLLTPEEFAEYLYELPTADVAPVVHGQWVDGRCSNCGVDIPTDDAHDAIFENECRFCYYCGAKMDGGDSDAAD